MKKIAAILLSAALVAPLAAPSMAQPAAAHNESHGNRANADNRGGARQQSSASGFKKFGKGEKFDSRRARNYQQIDYRKYKRLKAPPRGYRYVRSGDDVLLLSAAGVVAAVTTGVFR